MKWSRRIVGGAAILLEVFNSISICLQLFPSTITAVTRIRLPSRLRPDETPSAVGRAPNPCAILFLLILARPSFGCPDLETPVLP